MNSPIVVVLTEDPLAGNELQRPAVARCLCVTKLREQRQRILRIRVCGGRRSRVTGKGFDSVVYADTVSVTGFHHPAAVLLFGVRALIGRDRRSSVGDRHTVVDLLE